MKRFFSVGSRSRWLRSFRTWAFFAVAAFTVASLYPDQRSFRYSYKQGHRWEYRDLLAPFDFALPKTAVDWERERQAMKSSSPLIYTLAKDTVLEGSASEMDWMLDPSSKLPPPGRELHLLRVGDRLLKLDMDRLRTDPPLKQGLRLVWDDSLSLELEREAMEAMVPNQGKVAKGTLVIGKGATVDAEAYARLEALKLAYREGEMQGGLRWNERLGLLLLTSLLLFMLFLFLRNFRPALLDDLSSLSLILLMWIFAVALCRISLMFGVDYLLLAPIPILPIVLRAFFDTRLALFVHMLAILSVGLMAPDGLLFVFLHFIAGFYSIVSVSFLYRRAQLFLSLFKVLAIYGLVYTGLLLFRDQPWQSVESRPFLYLGLNSALVLLAFPMIYGFEKLFGLVSDLSLFELTDTNSPLLRELAERAPGTFQHSLQVANLCEAATSAIRGNPLLARAGALYHDIGKMKNPMYFIENQTTGLNPHDELRFEESAALIVGHVKEGIRLARKRNLPERLIDFIRTHHGTSTVQYFYRQHLRDFPDEEVDPLRFSYPGPRPFSKETAVLMMADSVEAASRSLVQKDRESTDRLVDAIVAHQMGEGQLEESDLSLKEIGIVKEVLKQKLREVYHFRVVYPSA